ncbi:MAG: S41 family peptidase [Thermoleophilia bacterium]
MVVVFGVFVAGVVVGGHAEATGLTRLSDPLRGFLLGNSGEDLTSQVLRTLRDDYYVPVDATKLDRTSVQAIVDSLRDPYTDYLDPDELKALRDHNEGAYVGVGIQVALRGGRIVITRTFPGGPAAKAGVRVGDHVTSIDGKDLPESVSAEAMNGFVAGIRGPEGSSVRLGVATGDARPRVLTIERARVLIPPVTSRIIASGGARIGYLALGQFTRGAADDLRDAIRAQRGKGVSALILDLRGDPGGLVTEAVGVAGAFLPDDSPVVTTKGEHSPEHTFRTDGEPVAGDLPLFVLVDRNSASASEIVAGALRDAKRGELVGEHTFGKALVQSTVVLRDGGALKLTTARYLTPSGYDLAKRGLPPAVKAVDDPHTPGVDEALRRAERLAAAAG